MPSKTIERTRSRRGGDESSPRSSKREQGWGAVASRQEVTDEDTTEPDTTDDSADDESDSGDDW